MKKIFILVLGIVLIVVGVQDLIRIISNPQDPGIWGALTEEYAARIILNVIIMIAGVTDVVLSRRVS